jgi:hypothetical protein
VAILERGGVLLRFAGGDGGAALAFISADVASRLVTLGAVTRVPGARPPVAGIALAEGAVVTVLEIGRATPPSYRPGDDWVVPGSDRAVLCDLGGHGVAITGGTVLTTGVFDADPEGDGVIWRGEAVPVLDVRALYAQAEAALWAERAVTSQPAGPPTPPYGLSMKPGALANAPPRGLSPTPTPPTGVKVWIDVTAGREKGNKR